MWWVNYYGLHEGRRADSSDIFIFRDNAPIRRNSTFLSGTRSPRKPMDHLATVRCRAHQLKRHYRMAGRFFTPFGRGTRNSCSRKDILQVEGRHALLCWARGQENLAGKRVFTNRPRTVLFVWNTEHRSTPFLPIFEHIRGALDTCRILEPTRNSPTRPSPFPRPPPTYHHRLPKITTAQRRMDSRRLLMSTTVTAPPLLQNLALGASGCHLQG